MATLVPGEKSRMYALGGLARGGAFRGGYVDNRMYISIGGAAHAGDVLLDTLTITDILDEAPSTCSFRVHDLVPVAGAELSIRRGSSHGALLFGGYALTVQEGYVGVPHHVQADVRAVDYTWLLGMRKVTGQYQNQSATAIVQDLVSKFAGANGFTTAAVAPGLPYLDQITFTNEDLPAAITRVCRRIGASWYCDYDKSVHVFTGADPQQAAPEAITPSHKSLAGFTASRERTQALTRVLVEGRGSSLLAGVPAGATILPVEAVDMFTPGADVFLKVSKSGADSTWHLDFTGVVPSAGGTLVGPGTAPSSGPTLTGAAGGAVDVGAHDYAYTWITAAGETRPSPIASIAAGTLPTPTAAPFVGYETNFSVQPPPVYGCWAIGDYVEFAQSYALTLNTSPGNSTPISPTQGKTAIAASGTGSYAAGFGVTFSHSPDPTVKYIIPWHRINGGPWFRWLTPEIVNVPGNPSAYLLHAYYPQSSVQQMAPESAPPTVRTVNVSAIATGPASVTGRKVYRTAANQSTLKLLTTLANNTATTYTDAAADSTLGAVAPVGDTSGIQVAAGTVNAGSTSIVVASTGPFTAAGGWALAGEQAIRYTGLGAGSLTGIPASGFGSLVGPIQYNTSIRSAPLLTGIPATGARALAVALNAGDEVYAVVQVDDTARQAQLAADLNLADGVREEWIQDRRLSIPEARARGQATLAARPLTDETVEYTCRDTRTASGQTVHVDLPAPINVTGDYRIQQVTWSNFRPRPEQPPTARVTASNRRFSFEDWLRIIKTGT
jgi:hypothetical protein